MSTPPTRQQPRPAPPPRPPSSRGSDLSLSTLSIAALASAAAAFVTSRVWAAGALWSAAASPVIVALVKEAINRPASKLQTVRLERGGRMREVEIGEAAPDAETGPVRVYSSSSPLRARRWKIAVATGLLAFAVVAIIYTVPELVAGASIGNGHRATTLFGGTSRHHSRRSSEKPKTTATPTPGATA